jgi:hypothetical protein
LSESEYPGFEDFQDVIFGGELVIFICQNQDIQDLRNSDTRKLLTIFSFITLIIAEARDI